MDPYQGRTAYPIKNTGTKVTGGGFKFSPTRPEVFLKNYSALVPIRTSAATVVLLVPSFSAAGALLTNWLAGWGCRSGLPGYSDRVDAIENMLPRSSPSHNNSCLCRRPVMGHKIISSRGRFEINYQSVRRGLKKHSKAV